MNSVRFESVNCRPIPMTEDKTVLWEAHELPAAQGILYASPELCQEAARMVLACAQEGPSVLADNETITIGQYADCIKIGDTLIKSFRPKSAVVARRERDTLMGLSAVRASTMLHVGLQRSQQGIAGQLKRIARRPLWNAPQMYAAFIPFADELPPVWAMSYEEGEYLPTLPLDRGSVDDRQTIYHTAIENCGSNPDQVFYDDHRQNLLVRRELHRQVFTKLDVAARRPYIW